MVIPKRFNIFIKNVKCLVNKLVISIGVERLIV